MIDGFTKEYAFLSMFFDKQITFNDLTYKNAEAAYQAQKTDNEAMRKKFTRLLPTEAIRRAEKLSLRDDWDSIKDEVLYQINKTKFGDVVLRQKLIETGQEELINVINYIDERGVFNGKGENKLGKVLMKIREELSHGEEA